MLCYVGKATKIFFFIVAVLAAVGLFIGLGVARHGRGHKASQPGPCQGGGGDGPCSPITSLPATAAAVPPPPQRQPLPVGPAVGGEMSPPPPPFLNPPTADVVPAPMPPGTATAAAPPSPSPPVTFTPPSPVPPTATAAAPSPVSTGQVGPGSGAQSPGQA